jgi:hypothetical protein
MANNTYTKTYADGAALSEAKLDASFQSLQMDLAQSALLTTGAVANTVLTATTPGSAATWVTPSDPKFIGVRNYGLAASVSSGSLIVALKSAAGTNATASDIVDVTFSSNGSASAVPQKFQLTTSLTLSVTASATLGVKSATTATLYVYGVRVSSSTLRLAISTDGSLDTGAAATTVAMASTSDVAGVVYSNASAGTYPTKLLGWVKASHTTGSWNAIYKVNLASGLNDPNGIANARTRSTTSVSTSTISVLEGGVAVSSGCGAFTSSSASYTDVTNLTVTIKTSGRPVFVGLVSDPTDNNTLGIQGVSVTQASARVKLLRGTTTIAIYTVESANTAASATINLFVPASSVHAIDAVSAGTYVYKVQVQKVAGTTVFCAYAKMVAYEL